MKKVLKHTVCGNLRVWLTNKTVTSQFQKRFSGNVAVAKAYCTMIITRAVVPLHVTSTYP